MGAQSKADENIAGAIKTFLAIMPISIVVYGFHVRNPLTIGLASVAGVLLQTVIPPHKQRLFLLLMSAIVFTLVYSLFGK
jgi:hypothetical protein